MERRRSYSSRSSPEDGDDDDGGGGNNSNLSRQNSIDSPAASAPVFMSEASFAVRAASLAFNTGGAAEAANEVSVLAAGGHLGNISVSSSNNSLRRHTTNTNTENHTTTTTFVGDNSMVALQSPPSGSGDEHERGGSSSSDPASGSDADAAKFAEIAAQMSLGPDGIGILGGLDGGNNESPKASVQKRRPSRVGRRNFSSILGAQDANAAVEAAAARRRKSSSSSLSKTMQDVVESDDSSNSGTVGIQAAWRRRRQRNGKRGGGIMMMSLPQKVCLALAAVSLTVGAILALVVLLPQDSPSVIRAKSEAKHVGEELELGLKVVVSGRAAAGLPVAHRSDTDAGGQARVVDDDNNNKKMRDLETTGGERPQHALVRGADGDIDDAVNDQAVRDGMIVHMRALERLHQPLDQVFATSTSDGENGAGGAGAAAALAMMGNPNVLPPLEAYNTAVGPHESDIYIPTLTSQNYADVWTPVNRMDVPVYWHIPKSGGATVRNVLGRCLDMVQASDLASHDRVLAKRLRSSLDILTNQDGLRYVNVDATTTDGLEKAKRLGLAAGGKADVIITHRLHDVATVFDHAHRGRSFALFRHPVKRASSMFYHRREAKWEPTYDESLADTTTLLEYATSEQGRSEEESNWVVRSLTNEFEAPLGSRHVEVAKEMLRRKVLVGITENFEQSVVRFEQYFGWWGGVANDVEVLRCQRDQMVGGDHRNDHPDPSPGTEVFMALAKRNWADLELYNYAKELFREQASLV